MWKYGCLSDFESKFLDNKVLDVSCLTLYAFVICFYMRIDGF